MGIDRHNFMDRLIGNWKTTRAARKAAKTKDRRDLKAKERLHKGTAFIRDRRRCRFPLCGCARIGLRARPEVSHDRHKGMGGDPSGARSKPELLITYCYHRHQDGIISRHKGTLRTRYLDPKLKNDGALIFELKTAELRHAMRGFAEEFRLANGEKARIPAWWEVARERAPQDLEPLTALQQAVLDRLAEMDI